MTGVELARIVRDIVPPVGASMATAVVEHQPGERLESGAWSGRGGRTTYRAAFVVDGLRKVPTGPAFDRPRDAIRLVQLINGEAPRRAPQPDLARAFGEATESRDAVAAPAEAPVGHGVSPRLCVACGRDLPPGSRPQRRTCSGACRVAAKRHPADTSGAVTVSPPPDPSEPDVDTRPSLGL